MTEKLLERLETLRHDLDTSHGAAHEAHLDHLEEAVMTLDARGVAVPHWARDRLAGRIDEEVENQFDNMPL
ncbi:hypothetical protein [Tropicibacter sp. S64]|uniref:hypothetical protein n=1 Tax=Tropicibacter sp. S64 TaxID=3415122 RepID=UPI003C7E6880